MRAKIEAEPKYRRLATAAILVLAVGISASISENAKAADKSTAYSALPFSPVCIM
jgi:hypothetical protein